MAASGLASGVASGLASGLPSGLASGLPSDLPSDLAGERPLMLLVDGHSLAFRAYYAFSKSREGGLRTKSGIPTSVAFGFLKYLLDVMVAQKPQAVALAFDLGGPTFRHEADETYKANRAETPEDFIPDVENLLEVLGAMALPVFVEPGYEADDVLGTLAQRGVEGGYRVKILSGDRDLFQLVDDDRQIRVLYLGNTFGKGRAGVAANEFDREGVREKMGIPPEQVVDFKALCGDPSDNIPGVKGGGPKTALELLKEFDSLQDIYDSLEQVKPTVRKKLEADRDAAFHSQTMARIVTDVEFKNLDFGQQWEQVALRGFDPQRVTPLLEKLELQSFLKQLQKLQGLLGGSDAPAMSSSVSPAASPAASPAVSPVAGRGAAPVAPVASAPPTVAARGSRGPQQGELSLGLPEASGSGSEPVFFEGGGPRADRSHPRDSAPGD